VLHSTTRNDLLNATILYATHDSWEKRIGTYLDHHTSMFVESVEATTHWLADIPILAMTSRTRFRSLSRTGGPIDDV